MYPVGCGFSEILWIFKFIKLPVTKYLFTEKGENIWLFSLCLSLQNKFKHTYVTTVSIFGCEFVEVAAKKFLKSWRFPRNLKENLPLVPEANVE